MVTSTLSQRGPGQWPTSALYQHADSTPEIAATKGACGQANGSFFFFLMKSLYEAQIFNSEYHLTALKIIFKSPIFASYAGRGLLWGKANSSTLFTYNRHTGKEGAGMSVSIKVSRDHQNTQVLLESTERKGESDTVWSGPVSKTSSQLMSFVRLSMTWGRVTGCGLQPS